jgi:hypothetical protein
MQRVESGDPWLWALVFFAVGNLANAVWMLFDPGGWYAGLPAAVPDTGPLNLHFVRDLGGAFAVMGGGLFWAAFRPAVRFPVLAGVALFYLMHALVHVTDTVAGRLSTSHWAIDFPGVYLPTIILLGLAAAAARKREAWR